MEKIKAFLSGKKTYIVSGLAIAAVWVDYFFNLGLSDLCTEEPCSITLQQAGAATWAAITAMTLRAGVAK
jgi:hypothetical protein